MAYPNNSVVHLTMRFNNEILAVGSGVIYQKDDKYYIVTAWHNLSGRNSETLNPLDKNKSIPNNLIVNIKLKVQHKVDNTRSQSGQSGFMNTHFILQLENENDTFYLDHPISFPRKDVAVIPIDPLECYSSDWIVADPDVELPKIKLPLVYETDIFYTDIQPIQDCSGTYHQLPENFDTNRLIEPGDELFVLGYPRGLSDDTYDPIWKRATVASDPKQGWNRQNSFLIDCASRAGMSGAPVISYHKDGNILVGRTVFNGHEQATALHGIYVGRTLDIESSQEAQMFEASIGTVWKSDVIDEIIESNHFALHSTQINASEKEIKDAIKKAWPETADYHSKLLRSELLLHSFASSVLRSLNGKATPKETKDLILEYAKSFE